MSFTIVIPDDFPPQIKGTRALEDLKKYGEVKLYNTKASSQEEFIQRMKEAEVVVNVRAHSKFIEEVFKNSPSLGIGMKVISWTFHSSDGVSLNARLGDRIVIG